MENKKEKHERLEDVCFGSLAATRTERCARRVFTHGDGTKLETHGAMAGDRSASCTCRCSTVTENDQMTELNYK